MIRKREKKIDKILEFQPQFHWYFGAGGHANLFFFIRARLHSEQGTEIVCLWMWPVFTPWHAKKHRKIAAKCTLRRENYLELQKCDGKGNFNIKKFLLFLSAYITHSTISTQHWIPRKRFNAFAIELVIFFLCQFRFGKKQILFANSLKTNYFH